MTNDETTILIVDDEEVVLRLLEENPDAAIVGNRHVTPGALQCPSVTLPLTL